MKNWALLTVVLYVIILTSVLWVVLLGAFWPELVRDLPPFIEAQLSGDIDGEDMVFWLCFVMWVFTMGLAQAALLVVPVRIATRRPVTKRWLFWPILASLFMLVLMVAAMYIAVHEHLANTKGLEEWHWLWAFSLIGVLWLGWTFLFGFYTGGREPRTFMSRAVKFLIAGSILELLVAVPTHVIARQRDYCCAGFGTFWGLAVGASVMLFAFGPGVFFLFIRRWGAIRPPADGRH